MDNKLQVLDQREVLGKDFKVYGDKDNPLFLAKDVAEWLDERDGYTVSRKVDEEEKLIHKICVGGQIREATFLTEDGFYEVLMQSRKSIAKPFKKEVKKILKQIRLTGGVVIEDREEEFINNYFTSFSEDVKKAMILDLKEQNKTKLTIQDWMDYFRVEINTIPYIKLDCDIAPEMPTKNMVFNTLLHIDQVSPGYLNRYANNIALTQKKELFEYNKKLDDFIYCSSKLADCGHSVNFQLSFADSDECFPCAIKKLANKHKLLIA